MPAPLAYLVRHGQTAWSVTGQHTGRTDLPLTAEGERAARSVGDRLRGGAFALVLTSPLRRATRTCELAGFDGESDADLVEWDYGRYEGRTTAEIKAESPAWDLFRDGCPDGETAAQVAAQGCGLDSTFARYLLLGTGSVSVLSYDHDDRREPAVKSWNQTG